MYNNLLVLHGKVRIPRRAEYAAESRSKINQINWKDMSLQQRFPGLPCVVPGCQATSRGAFMTCRSLLGCVFLCVMCNSRTALPFSSCTTMTTTTKTTLLHTMSCHYSSSTRFYLLRFPVPVQCTLQRWGGPKLNTAETEKPSLEKLMQWFAIEGFSNLKLVSAEEFLWDLQKLNS